MHTVVEEKNFTERELFPDVLKDYNFKKNVLSIRTENNVLLNVYVLESGMIRFRFGVEGSFEDDFSYAIDPKFKPAKTTAKVEESKNSIVLKTDKLVVTIDKNHLHTSISNHDGIVLSEDEKGFHWEESFAMGSDIVQMSKKVQIGEVYFGMGDKPMSLNLKGKRVSNWGTDSYGYTESWDPLYKNIPFYYGLHHGEAYGIFFDNSFKSHFDFAHERHSATSYWADGGEMNYYFIYDSKLIEITKAYARLTGVHEMPPLWALGYQQSKWSYYPESEVRDLAKGFRDKKIPCDVLHIDIDYMDGFRCFTWDPEKFPAPKKMISDLAEDGFKTIVIIDPGIKLDHDYWVFKEALEKGYFCKRADGKYMKGKVWPGDCYFPDYTNPEVRAWWGGLFKGLVKEDGVAGVWNDMNEPALFEVDNKTFPDDVRHHYDNHWCSHRKAHNVYGMQMVRATNDGLREFGGGKRKVAITRSGYAGLQRFSSVWTGDNIATWEHLKIANVQCQRLAISGVSFAGSDVGGFLEQPDAELFVRWIQLGSFHSFYRTHSSGDHGDQEPWSFGETALNLVRKAIEFRYKMLPYLYTAFYEHHSTGTPFLKPIIFEDQLDERYHTREKEFIVGRHLLVSPIQQPGITRANVYLPKGEWVDFHTGELYDGPQEMYVECTIDKIPLFLRAGGVMPLYPVMQYVGEKVVKQVELVIAIGSDSFNNTESILYDDGGDNYDYVQNKFELCKFKVTSNEKEIKISQNISGDFTSKVVLYQLKLIGKTGLIKSVEVDNVEVPFYINDEAVYVESIKKGIKNIIINRNN
jgi:alpha-glucosidase